MMGDLESPTSEVPKATLSKDEVECDDGDYAPCDQTRSFASGLGVEE